jgi:hypothetical protein
VSYGVEFVTAMSKLPPVYAVGIAADVAQVTLFATTFA